MPGPYGRGWQRYKKSGSASPPPPIDNISLDDNLSAQDIGVNMVAAYARAASDSFGLADTGFTYELANSGTQLDWRADTYVIGGATQANADSLAGMTFARANPSLAIAQDETTGVLRTFSPNLVRRTTRGWLLEPAGENIFENSSASGAVVGGAFPTRWIKNDAPGVVDVTCIGTGTTNGVPYIDIEVDYNMPSSGVQGWSVYFQENWMCDMPGQPAVLSVYSQLLSGTLPILKPDLGVESFTESWSYLGGSFALLTLESTPKLTEYRANLDPTSLHHGCNVYGLALENENLTFSFRLWAPQWVAVADQGNLPGATSGIITTNAGAGVRSNEGGAIIPNLNSTSVFTCLHSFELPDATGVTLGSEWQAASGSAKVQFQRNSSDEGVIKLIDASNATVFTHTVSGLGGVKVLKFGISYDGTQWRAAINGTAMTAVTAANATLTKMVLGAIGGYYRDFSIDPASAMSNAQLVTATT